MALSVLDTLPTPDQLTAYLQRFLRETPGVQAVRVSLNGVAAKLPPPAKRGQPQDWCLPVKTKDTEYGHIWITEDASGRFRDYVSVCQNIANIIAQVPATVEAGTRHDLRKTITQLPGPLAKEQDDGKPAES